MLTLFCMLGVETVETVCEQAPRVNFKGDNMSPLCLYCPQVVKKTC